MASCRVGLGRLSPYGLLIMVSLFTAERCQHLVGGGDGAEDAARHLHAADGAGKRVVAEAGAAVAEQQTLEAEVISLAHGAVGAQLSWETGQQQVFQAGVVQD